MNFAATAQALLVSAATRGSCANGALREGMRLAEASVMSTTQQVVVGIDFSHSSIAALDRALALASRAPFHVLHFACIVDPHAGIATLATSHVDITYADRVRDELARTIESALRTMDHKGHLHFHVHVRIARSPANELLALAEEVGADLIVLGCKGRRGLDRLVLGSVAERVVREAGCAVLIARPKEYTYVEHTDVVEVQPKHPSFGFTYDSEVGIVEPMRWPGA